MLNIKVVGLPVFGGSVSESVQHQAGIAASGVHVSYDLAFSDILCGRQYNIYAFLL